MKISIVIPIYNEKESLEPLHASIAALYPRLDLEVILVDDGSVDGSGAALKAIAAKDPRVKAVLLRKNFGQTAALAAGFDAACGEIVVSMDADLQNDPADIPRLIAKMQEGYDVVSGWRKDRKDPFLSRRLPSFLANKLISFITGVKLNDYGCMLKAYRREVIEHVDLYGQMHRFIPALAAWIGASIAEIEVAHHPRRFGVSKYGIGRTTRVLLDLITVKFFLRYATRPLHVFGMFGLGFLAAGAALFVYVVVERQCFGVPMGSRPLFLLSVLSLIAGIQTIGIGLLAEMIVRTYHESQKKPIYVIREVVGGR